jgi:hypothetical protein
MNTMNNNFDNDIQAVNQTFDDMLANFKSNYVNFHTNAMLSLPSLPPPLPSPSPSPSVTTSATTATAAAKSTPPPPTPVTNPDPNDALLKKYRYSANQLLEKVRSQISLNSKQISSINTDITPIQKTYLQMTEAGTALDQTKSAAVLSLEDYNELYRTTVFGTMMYVIGAGVILYLLYKPRIQSEI